MSSHQLQLYQRKSQFLKFPLLDPLLQGFQKNISEAANAVSKSALNEHGNVFC